MNHEIFSVAGQVAVVTGASRGIGKVLSEGLLDGGAKVVGIARSAERLAPIDAHENGQAIALDLGDSGSAEKIVEQTVDRFGRIDCLVNNAGITLPESDPYDDSTWQQTMEINLNAVFRVSRLTVLQMKDQEPQGGSIINIASIGALLGFPGNPSYQAAKGALRQLTKAMAHDFGKYGVRVNTICPGYIRTDMANFSYKNPEMRKQREDRTMLGRYGEASELVGPCLFLASNASSYMTGCDLIVDGGWTAKGL